MSKFISKSSKAVAVHGLVLIIIIAFFLFLTAVITYKWAAPTAMETTGASCAYKKLSFCIDWMDSNFDPAKKPTWWASRAPNNCDAPEIKVNEPQSKDDCSLIR